VKSATATALPTFWAGLQTGVVIAGDIREAATWALTIQLRLVVRSINTRAGNLVVAGTRRRP
jgi:hypothetical protein